MNGLSELENCETVKEAIVLLQEITCSEKLEGRESEKIKIFTEKLSELIIYPESMRFTKQIRSYFKESVEKVIKEIISPISARDVARELAFKIFQLQNRRELAELDKNKEPRTRTYKLKNF